MKIFHLSVYFVADPDVCLGRPVLDVVKEAVEGGVTMVQYRNKTGTQDQILKDAHALSQLLKPLRVPLIINDHVLVAKQVGAAGVHLGQSDWPPAVARDVLGPLKIIGVTAFDPAHFKAIDPNIVDYAGTGPFYPTATKPDKSVLGAERFSNLVRLSPVPVVGIGGITPDKAAAVIKAGANGVCMMRAISEHPEPRNSAAAFVNNVKEAKRQLSHEHSQHPQHRRV